VPQRSKHPLLTGHTHRAPLENRYTGLSNRYAHHKQVKVVYYYIEKEFINERKLFHFPIDTEASDIVATSCRYICYIFGGKAIPNRIFVINISGWVGF
jgi:hypothetical protein